MEAKTSRIKYFPVSFFSVVMGLVGFTIALQKAEKVLKISSYIPKIILYVSIMAFVLIAFLYALKILKFPEEFKKELSHPVRINFIPTFSISILLFSIAYLEYSKVTSKLLWIVGTILHLMITLFVLLQWIDQTHFTIQHYNPSWFIPVVGNILVPVAGVEHADKYFSWFFFSVGIVFWIVLFTILFYRIIFHHPIPQKLIPTFFIMIAPPSVGLISYVKLTNGLDAFAKVIYFFAMFLILLLIAQIKKFVNTKFYLSWWAYSFPLAAFSIATFVMLSKTHLSVFKYIFGVSLVVLSFVVIILAGATIASILKKNICIEEE
jgi:tellurite resistance protein